MCHPSQSIRCDAFITSSTRESRAPRPQPTTRCSRFLVSIAIYTSIHSCLICVAVARLFMLLDALIEPLKCSQLCRLLYSTFVPAFPGQMQASATCLVLWVVARCPPPCLAMLGGRQSSNCFMFWIGVCYPHHGGDDASQWENNAPLVWCFGFLLSPTMPRKVGGKQFNSQIVWCFGPVFVIPSMPRNGRRKATLGLWHLCTN